jgi:hypothetical protein
MSYIGKIPANAVLTTADLADGIVTAAKIEDGTVVAAEIASNAVTTAKINADAVTGAKIADDAINSEHYTNGSIDTAHIAADQIVGSLIADNAINSEHYTDGSIDTAHIADAQITAAKLASGVGGKILQAVTVTSSSEVTNGTTNYATSGIAKAITPSVTSSKILVLVGSNFRVSGDGGASNKPREGKIAIFRGTVSGTLLQQQIIGITNREDSSDSGNQTTTSIAFAYLDNPNTTSATTYTVGIAGLNNGDAQAQPFNYGSSMVLLEVGA